MQKIVYTILLCFTCGYVSAQCTPVIHTNTGNNFICDGGTTYVFASLADTYQWYLDGVAIIGATNHNYGATIPGSYTVEVDSVGCVATSAPLLLTANSSPDIPGSITGNDTLCEGEPCTFSIDPVQGADKYEWTTNHPAPAFWQWLNDDTTNIATAYAGPSAGTSSPQLTVKVRAINACGVTAFSTKNIQVYSAIQHLGYGIDIDVLGTGMAPFCPSSNWDQQIRVEVRPASSITGYIAPVTYQWYLDNVILPGETDKYLTIHRGGDYVVEATAAHCNTLTILKHVKQNVPGSATITPSGPLDFCVNNAQPLHVVFDMTGVDGDFSWNWILAQSSPYSSPYYAGSVYSILPDTTGFYTVWAGDGISSYNCDVMYPIGVQVTIPPPLEVTQTDDTLFATPGYDTYQWFESGVLLTGETNQKLILTVDGFYSVEGIFMNGCVENSLSFDPLFSPPPPNEENEEEEPVQPTVAGVANIYPNPNHGTFTVFAEVPRCWPMWTIP